MEKEKDEAGGSLSRWEQLESSPLLRRSQSSSSIGTGLGDGSAAKAKREHDIATVRLMGELHTPKLGAHHHDHDDKSLLEWSWAESVCCDMASDGSNRIWWSLMICSLSPCLFVSFAVTLLGRVVHNFYDQGMPLHSAETILERKVRVQGVLTTTGLMICIIAISLVLIVHRYFQMRIEGTFDDIATVYLRTLVTIASSINVIFSNIIFLNAMRKKWQQSINLFIIGSYAIVLSQVAMGSFDTWILISNDYSISDVVFCILHLSETLYSAIQCLLYQQMWNYHIKDVPKADKDGGDDDDASSGTGDDGELVASTNIVMLTLVNWASILISFRFTSISDYIEKRSNG
jgi:hypothetical protein